MERSAVRRTRTLLVLVVVAALVALGLAWSGGTRAAAPRGARAATGVQIYATVTGAKQGVFKGDSTARTHLNEITVSGYQYEMTVPRDPATGVGTGKRQHKPVVITHELDGASPQFLAAASTGEILKSVVIDFWETSARGEMVNYYRVTLTNAQLADVRQYSSGTGVLEDDAFVFQKIEQQDLVQKTTFIDTWALGAA